MPHMRYSTRGGRGSSFTESLAARTPAQVVAVSALLFGLVFALRTLDATPHTGIHLFYIVPVILLALRFGPRGGLIGACVALVLFATWSLGSGARVELATWVSPALTVFIVGLLVGLLSQSLRRSEHRFRSVAEDKLEPFMLCSGVRDDDGGIVDFRADFVNDAAADSVGMTREEMTGRLLSELFPGRLESGLIGEYAQVVETGEPIFREAVDHLNVLGERTLVRAVDIRVAKLDDGIQMTWRDITEQVRLRRQRDWLVAVVENASDAVLSVGRDRRIASWSASATKLYGYSAEEAIGRPHTLLVDPGETEKRNAYLDRVLAGERPGPLSTVERHKDGTALRTTFIGWPILGEDGTVIGAARIVQREPE
jgi:PAS domain S-box-containing protein